MVSQEERKIDFRTDKQTFFPSEEVFLLGGIANILNQTLSVTIPQIPATITLTAQLISFFRKHRSGDLTIGYLERRVSQEDLDRILNLDIDTELIEALPSLFAKDLNVAMAKPDAPKRFVLCFDTHEAFWGNWRDRGEASFFKQDEWLRSLLAQLDLSAGIVVVVAGRELPRWAEAAHWNIPANKLDAQLVWHMKAKDAMTYLQKVGINNQNLGESLINYASFESDQVHPLFLGMCADVVLIAQEKEETLTPEDFTTTSQMEQKLKILLERLLKYVDEDVRDAVDALSACRAFDRQLFFDLGEELRFNATNASFRLLTRFSFVWQAEQRGQDWYCLHPLIRRLNIENNREITGYAHTSLEQYYRKQGNLAEAIYHAICQNWQRGVREWLEVFQRATEKKDFELCRTLVEIRKELSF